MDQNGNKLNIMCILYSFFYKKVNKIQLSDFIMLFIYLPKKMQVLDLEFLEDLLNARKARLIIKQEVINRI